MPPVSIIVPAFNEAQTIAPLIDALKGLGLAGEILVIDDGSTDGTGAILDQIDGIRVIHQPYNKGNGAAVKTGLKAAENDWTVVIDGDGQHDPADIPRLIDRLDRYDLVIGARARETEAGPMRRLGNRLLCGLAGLLTGFHIQDLTCGLRAFKRSLALKFISLYPNGFSFPTTSTMCFLMAGYNVGFVPIKAGQRAPGSTSKIKFTRDGFKFVIIIFRVLMFNPLKIFLPLGLGLLGLGLLWSIKTIWVNSAISAGGLLLLSFGLNFLFFGFVLDQVVGLRMDLIHRSDK